MRSEGATETPTLSISAEDFGSAQSVVTSRRQLSVAGRHWGLSPLTAATSPTLELEGASSPTKRAKGGGHDGAGKGAGMTSGKDAGRSSGKDAGNDGAGKKAGNSGQGGRVDGIVRSKHFHVSESEGRVTWSGQSFDLGKLRCMWSSKNPKVPLHLTGALTLASEWSKALPFIPSSVSGEDLEAYKAWIEAGSARKCKLDFGEAPGN